MSFEYELSGKYASVCALRMTLLAGRESCSFVLCVVPPFPGEHFVSRPSNARCVSFP